MLELIKSLKYLFNVAVIESIECFFKDKPILVCLPETSILFFIFKSFVRDKKPEHFYYLQYPLAFLQKGLCPQR